MNMNLLNEKIEASGYKREYIAQQLNITRFGLRDKMLNPNRWKASEAARKDHHGCLDETKAIL